MSRAPAERIGLACFASLLLASASAADEASPCMDRAAQQCWNIEDETQRERCEVEREIACESGRPMRGASRTRQGASDFREACREDYEALCSDLGTEASRREIGRCLRDRGDTLSSACQSALDARPRRGGGREGAGVCRDEIRALCGDATDRRARRECVEERRDALSDPCRQRVEERMSRRPGGGGRGEPPGL